MDRLEEALRQALDRNADETDRWTKYKEEQETAITNLKQFAEKLSVDVMVPVGSKAFMPGQLYHTNEILVSHYQGFFSKCSSQQAQILAKKRLANAQERLESLKNEKQMYQNKLEKPLAEGVLPSDKQQEIIEPYDEEAEKKWRIEHRIRMREEKLREAKKNAESKHEKDHKDVMNLLDDLEIMEELELELDKLQVEDDETLDKLMSGEIQLPAEKPRISHQHSKSIVVGNETVNNDSDIEQEKCKNDSIPELMSTISKIISGQDSSISNTSSISDERVDYTNNNRQPNSTDYGTDEDSESTSSSDLPPQLLDIEDEAKHLNSKDKLSFFKKKIKEITKELQNLQVSSVDDVAKKLDKIEVRDYLFDYIEILKDEIENEVEVEKRQEIVPKKRDKKAKRISFATEDEVQIIDNKMAANTVTRSKIELSSESYSALNLKPPQTTPQSSDNSSVAIKVTPPVTPESPVISKREEILQKVERCLEYVSTNQSHTDFNLIDKIIGATVSSPRTLHINFTHSNAEFVHPVDENSNSDENVAICCPADIYEMFNPSSSMEEQSDVMSSGAISPQPKITQTSTIAKTDETKEDKHVKMVPEVDNRLISQVPEKQEPKEKKEQFKPILKNKDKVQEEERNVIKNAKPAKTIKKKKEEIGYELIIGDVIENIQETGTLTDLEKKLEKEMTEPDPLPEEKFVDAIAPKKRISRFKQMRTN